VQGALNTKTRRLIVSAWRPTTATAVLLIAVFGIVALVQFQFVRRKLFATAADQCASWADLVVKESSLPSGFSLAAFRQAAIDAPSWYILASDGTIVDIEGYIPGSLGAVSLNLQGVFDQPRSIVSALGERWRILGGRVEGGSVVVGIRNPDQYSGVDERLRANLSRFGKSLSDAAKIKSRETDEAVEFAAFDEIGSLQNILGGLPLRVDPTYLPRIISNGEVVLDGKPYIFAARKVSLPTNVLTAAIYVPRETTVEHAALHQLLRFNSIILLVACIAMISLAATYFVRNEIRRKASRITLTDARRQGEGQHVEFKRTLTSNDHTGVEDGDAPIKVLRFFRKVSPFLPTVCIRHWYGRDIAA